jgi:hypothetical protein
MFCTTHVNFLMTLLPMCTNSIWVHECDRDHSMMYEIFYFVFLDRQKLVLNSDPQIKNILRKISSSKQTTVNNGQYTPKYMSLFKMFVITLLSYKCLSILTDRLKLETCLTAMHDLDPNFKSWAAHKQSKFLGLLELARYDCNGTPRRR